jgi:hypothetical protein
MPYGEMKSITLTSASMTTTPQFSPAAGAYAAGQAITLASESGTTIFYRVSDAPFWPYRVVASRARWVARWRLARPGNLTSTKRSLILVGS